LTATVNGAAFVDVRSVSKWFGDLQVLNKVSLDVHEHSVVCLIGASGSGKSTLLWNWCGRTLMPRRCSAG